MSNTNNPTPGNLPGSLDARMAAVPDRMQGTEPVLEVRLNDSGVVQSLPGQVNVSYVLPGSVSTTLGDGKSAAPPDPENSQVQYNLGCWRGAEGYNGAL